MPNIDKNKNKARPAIFLCFAEYERDIYDKVTAAAKKIKMPTAKFIKRMLVDTICK